jgi:hypothetical protein
MAAKGQIPIFNLSDSTRPPQTTPRPSCARPAKKKRNLIVRNNQLTFEIQNLALVTVQSGRPRVLSWITLKGITIALS